MCHVEKVILNSEDQQSLVVQERKRLSRMKQTPSMQVNLASCMPSIDTMRKKFDAVIEWQASKVPELCEEYKLSSN